MTRRPSAVAKRQNIGRRPISQAPHWTDIWRIKKKGGAGLQAAPPYSH
jgi:hypothetical protein